MSDDNASLREQLAAHRVTLAALLRQVAMHTQAYAPPAQLTGIDEARAAIARLKIKLRASGDTVDDLPQDVASSEEVSPQPISSLNVEGNISLGDRARADAAIGTNSGTAIFNIFQKEQSLLNAVEERLVLWQELLKELCEQEFAVDEEVLLFLQYAIWPELETPQQTEPGSELFQRIVIAVQNYRPRDYNRFLAFILLTAKELQIPDQGRLEAWVIGALEKLNIPRESVNNLCEPYWRSYKALKDIPASLMVVIREEHPGKGYSVTASFSRPTVGRHMCSEQVVISNAHELRELLKTMLAKERPYWLGSGIWIEFLLPETLLLNIDDEWKFDTWKYDEYSSPRKRIVNWTLGTRYPIVVRCTERLFARDWEHYRKAWKAKATRLSNWLNMDIDNSQIAAPPRIGCFDSAHHCYIHTHGWSHEDVLAVIMRNPPESATEESYQEAVFTLLEQGLPVGLWLVPGAPVDSPQNYMDQYFAPEQLHGLPQNLRDARGLVNDSSDPAANLILFWDEVGREPPEWPFSAPKRRASWK